MRRDLDEPEIKPLSSPKRKVEMAEPSVGNSTGRKGKSPELKVSQAMLRKPLMPEKEPNHGLTTLVSTRRNYL